MPWQLVDAPSPVIKFLETGGRVRWNDATQCMLGYPARVDFLYNSDEGCMGFRAGGQYRIDISDDELRYEIVITDALQSIGLNLEDDYEVTPQLVDHSEGEIAGMVGAVYVPMPE